MIIKLVNPEVMVKLIDLNLCTIDGVMTLKSLRKRSEPLPNGKQSRGIFAWRAEKSRIMLRLFANLFDLITFLSSSHQKATARDFFRAPVLCLLAQPSPLPRHCQARRHFYVPPQRKLNLIIFLCPIS
jgi:hypothetical protein